MSRSLLQKRVFLSSCLSHASRRTYYFGADTKRPSQACKVLPSENEKNRGSLRGLKVLDLSRILAAPFCSQILADYGADVIKVEQPGKGDDTRHWKVKGEASRWKTDDPISCYFSAVNRNKRSITLDLKKKEAVEVLYKIAKTSDIFLENFIPGKADELGIGYETISKINPRIIYASISGYGPTGPYSHRAGYDAIAAAEGGLMHISGTPDGPPVRPGLGMVDMCTGLYMHGAILSALYSRNISNRGQHISNSLFETQISLLTNIGTNWLNLGLEGKRLGNAHASIVPYNTYQTSEGAWIALGANNEHQFVTLMNRIGQPHLLEDPRYATNPSRVENRKELDKIITDIIKTKTTDEWMALFEGSGLAHGPVNSMEKVFAHPQAEAREMVKEVSNDAIEGGKMKCIGVPVKFSETKGQIRRRAPFLGEDTVDVLREIGYTDNDIQRLKRDGIT